MTSIFNDVRFGKWDAILNTVPVQEHHIYATVLWHWARGMAFAGKNNAAMAKKELVQMQEKMKAPDMQVVMEPFNAPVSAAKVAEKILEGVIAEKENKQEEAILFFTQAAVNEDALVYTEPRDWLLPSRHYLGNALLNQGKAAKAATVFKEELRDNPNNHWSLYGLYKALEKQKKNSEAARIKKQYNKAFEGSDIAAGHIVF